VAPKALADERTDRDQPGASAADVLQRSRDELGREPAFLETGIDLGGISTTIPGRVSQSITPASAPPIHSSYEGLGPRSSDLDAVLAVMDDIPSDERAADSLGYPRSGNGQIARTSSPSSS